ncbi:MAG: FAD-dependent oxidoreductase [Ignavibacteriales bacterium]|nr:FAD-dependent oxidoreductase [Ignavibacteriales bacterium]
MTNKKSKSAIIIGSGLGGLSTALRLSTEGYDVTVIEKHSKPGGRLNQLKMDGFTFDVGPSFMSMSWELEELFNSYTDSKIQLSLKNLIRFTRFILKVERKPYRIFGNLLTILKKNSKTSNQILQQKLKNILKEPESFFMIPKTKL